MPDDLPDPHRLRQFISVAQHLNITRAAAELHLTQQAVSSTIKSLERDLGVELLRRSGRRIELTAAGEELRRGAVPVLDASAALLRATRAAARGGGEHLTIAHTPAISADEVYDLTAPVRSAHPAASITVRQSFPDEITEALRTGAVDVGLRRGAATPEGLAATVVGYTPLHLAVSATHRLATRPSAALTDLAGEQLILWGQPGDSFYADFLLSVCRRAGFEPTTTVTHIQGAAPTTAVIDTPSFAFVTAEPGIYHHGQVRVLGLDDRPLAPIQAMWLRYTRSPLRQTLLDGSAAHHDG